MRVLLCCVLGLALVAGACSSGDDDPAPVEIEGLRTYEGLSNGHLSGEIEYPQWPPVGGDHNPVWQKCGFYSVRIPPERAVHSMEHGAVWVAYTEGTDVASLLAQTITDEYLLLSPLEDLDAPMVASAWGAQIDVESADDPRLEQFIDTYSRQGPESAPCVQGGVGNPSDDPGPGLDI